MLKKSKTYEQVCNSFRWKIPEFFNIGVDICDKWAQQRYRLALINLNERGEEEKYTFWDLKNLSNKLGNSLLFCGIRKGDRVGILLPQCPETAICHIAVYKIGGIAISMSTLLGPEAIEYRLSNCEAKGVITNEASLNKILEIREKLPHLKIVIVTGGEKQEGVLDLWKLIEKASNELKPVKTKATDPALIVYTSGTTGPPKGALHAQRDLLGHLPGTEFPHNFFPKNGDIIWTPADWAWIAGLMDVLLSSWHHGIPVFCHRTKKFDPEETFYIIAKYGIRNALIPPTALKMMRQVKDPRSQYNYNLRSVVSSSEKLGEELLDWGKEVFGLTINEVYGQTETHLVVGNCSEIMGVRSGSMGRAIPGHKVEVVDDSGVPLPPGTVGEISVERSSTVMFLGYWRNPEATKEKTVGDRWLMGDLAKKDEDGYFWFVARKDDLINSAGYRIGPAEIEDCLIKHPAVGMAAAVGSPDDLRGEVVKAFIVLKPDVTYGPGLEEEIKNYVKSRLAAYEYPREIEFVSELPITATGKIMRKELRKMELERKSKETI
jgi:acetyl-CoA synthetase